MCDIMTKYNISFTFDDNTSINDIFIRVLLRKVIIILLASMNNIYEDKKNDIKLSFKNV